MADQVARARDVVRPRARRAARRGPHARSGPGLIMAAIYRTLLDEIERDGYRVLDRRIALTPLRKLWIAWKTRAPCRDAARVQQPHVAVVGGGWAGCAAAVTLAHARRPRHAVRAGAIARRPRAPRRAVDGIALDNGQHLLLGAYRQTLRADRSACTRRGRARALFHRLPLTLRPFGAAHDRTPCRVEAWRAAGAAASRRRTAGRARARRCAERIALIARFPPPRARRLPCAARADRRAVLRRHAAPRVRRGLGAAVPRRAQHAAGDAHRRRSSPTCCATAFAGRARDSDFLVPAVDLSALLSRRRPRASSTRRGGTIRTGAARARRRAAATAASC